VAKPVKLAAVEVSSLSAWGIVYPFAFAGCLVVLAIILDWSGGAGLRQWMPVAPAMLLIALIAGAYGVTRLFLVLAPPAQRNAAAGSEEQYRQILDTIPAIVFCADPEGRPTYFSQALLNYAGITLDQIRESMAVFAHPDELATVTAAWAHAVASGTPHLLEHRIRAIDGTYRWFQARAQPLRDDKGNIVRWFGIAVDIDDRKRAEIELLKSEEHLKAIMETLPVMIARALPNGDTVYVNQRTLDFIGVPAHELTGTRWISSIHADDADAIMGVQRKAFSTGTPFKFTFRLRHADGLYRWVYAQGDPLSDPAGQIINWYFTVIDIDEQKRAEEAVRESEKRLRLIIDTIPIEVWCAGPAGAPTYFSQRVLTYFGLHKDDGSDFSWANAIHPEDLERVAATWRRAVETGEHYRVRCRHRRADGVFRWCEARADPLRGKDGGITGWYGVVTDIEESVRLEEAMRDAQARLLRASQVATIAELSASIAHEINQPLAAIVFTGNACRRWLEADPPNIERAQIAAERIVRDGMETAEIVQRMRDLFRHSEPAKKPLAINELIVEVLGVVTDLRKDNVRVQTDLADHLPSVLADRGQIQQVIANLVHNAFDAMDSVDLPLLTVRTRLEASDSIVVEVIDRGSGLTDQERIFDPFFTTKAHGMGMGLAICRSITNAHGGRLWARANEDRGTIFSFSIPLQSQVASSVANTGSDGA